MRNPTAAYAWVVLLATTMAWGMPGVAQSPLNVLPDDVKKWVLFDPDPGQLSFVEREGYRTVVYARSQLQRKPGVCEQVAGLVETVIIDDFGASEALAQQNFEKQRNYWRQLPVLQGEKPFLPVDQGVVFDLDWRYREGELLCGSQVRDTMFRVGSRVALTSEEFRNRAPTSDMRLAQEVFGMLRR